MKTRIQANIETPVKDLTQSSRLGTQLNNTSWHTTALLRSIQKTFEKHLDYVNGGKAKVIDMQKLADMYCQLNTAIGLLEWIPDYSQQLEEIADGRKPNTYTENDPEGREGKPVIRKEVKSENN